MLHLVTEDDICHSIALATRLQRFDMPVDTPPLPGNLPVHAAYLPRRAQPVWHAEHLAMLFVEFILVKLKRCVDKFFPALVYQLKYQRISSVAPDAVFVEFQFHTCHITLSLFEFSAKIE